MEDRKQEAVAFVMKVATQIWDRTLQGQTDYEKDKATLLKLIHQLDDLQAYSQKGRVTINLGVLELMHANYTTALEALERGRAIDHENYRNHSSPDALEGQMAAIKNIGEVYRIVGDFARAKEHYQMVYDLANQRGPAGGDPDSDSIYYTNIGLIALMTGDLDAAEAGFGHALRLFSGKQSQHLLAAVDAWRGLADVRLLRGNISGAWDAVNVAFNAVEDKANHLHAGQCHLTAMHILAKNPNASNAPNTVDDHLAEAEAHVAQLKAASAKAVVWLEEAYYQRQHGTPAMAHTFAERARNIFEAHGMIEGMAIATRI